MIKIFVSCMCTRPQIYWEAEIKCCNVYALAEAIIQNDGRKVVEKKKNIYIYIYIYFINNKIVCRNTQTNVSADFKTMLSMTLRNRLWVGHIRIRIEEYREHKKKIKSKPKYFIVKTFHNLSNFW
uniref:Uncharacterized protein n=1 Tax=Octopus bimaculoides TaxID=37653 RepID=A0A0L8ID60_OCTBM